jgi:prepilin-type N-terminal cleavage/methylation domain-containing protein
MGRRGFTLVELSVVVLILGIMAGAVTLHMASPMQRAGLTSATAEIVSFDHLTRTQSRESDLPMRLVVDLAEHRLQRTSETGDPLGTAFELPSGYRITRLLVGEKTIYSGSASITCSRLGAMPTYAVLVEAPNTQKRWVVVAGLTGQTIESDDEKEVLGILGVLKARSDAR